jgi:hypothetical protein
MMRIPQGQPTSSMLFQQGLNGRKGIPMQVVQELAGSLRFGHLLAMLAIPLWGDLLNFVQ